MQLADPDYDMHVCSSSCRALTAAHCLLLLPSLPGPFGPKAHSRPRHYLHTDFVVGNTHDPVHSDLVENLLVTYHRGSAVIQEDVGRMENLLAGKTDLAVSTPVVLGLGRCAAPGSRRRDIGHDMTFSFF